MTDKRHVAAAPRLIFELVDASTVYRKELGGEFKPCAGASRQTALQARSHAESVANAEEVTMPALFPLSKAFTLLEPGPVVLITTFDGKKPNIMTISWTMVTEFTPRFAIATGAWNHSYAALKKTKECVIAIPTVDQIDQVLGIGTCTGTEVDKFERFGFTPVAASHVRSPLIRDCLANIECKVIDIVTKHSIVILEGIAVHVDHHQSETRTLHAVGDGTFIVDGERINKRARMLSKLPPGV
jgi:flavin reductase (DIM6/NTAB) family NADH-FMN oxidoreductase RutF